MYLRRDLLANQISDMKMELIVEFHRNASEKEVVSL